MKEPRSSVSESGHKHPVHVESSDSESDYDSLFEGCFLDPGSVEDIIQRLRVKKNLILQGPPGTGKTWLAKRLGFALTGSRSREQLRAVQFHANLSY